MNLRRLAVPALVAAALTLTACGGASIEPPEDPTSEVSQGGAVVTQPLEGATSPAAPTETTPPDTGYREINVNDVFSGQAHACDLVDLEDVSTVVTGPEPQATSGATTCQWIGSNGQSLLFEFSRDAWPVSTMQRFDNELQSQSPCPEFPDGVYGFQRSNVGVWCQNNGVNLLFELQTGSSSPPATDEQAQALGPLMQEVLPKTG
jgi:hypothetical protein